jgi:hypothetical protein
MERRAVAGHQRDLLVSLRAMGAAAMPVIDLETVTGPAGIIVSLVLPQHRVELAGVAPVAARGARRAVTDRGAGQPPVLADCGRYGPWWWLSAACASERFTLLGSHLKLVSDRGRPDPEGGPAGWGTRPSDAAWLSDAASPSSASSLPGTARLDETAWTAETVWLYETAESATPIDHRSLETPRRS